MKPHKDRQSGFKSDVFDDTDLVRTEKLKALGLMSAGLAHEINNPLNYSLLGLELLKQDGRSMTSGEFDGVVSDIENGLTRIRNIVRDLTIFVGDESAGEMLDSSFLVGDVVNSAIRVTSSAHEGIQIVPTLDTPYRVKGDISSIAQVLVNLIANAADSIRERRQEGGKIDLFGRLQGSRYVVEVIDNGLGISRDELEDLFDPFYSTKNSGTGLGMTICKSIVERHGGSIRVESEYGHWTSIAFDLPVVP